ncbi:MAG: hypothetical protein HKN76_18720 [Saprospiraceae bacterium]|nr:hypothetical protein [Saprospiraceae bacterium]
MKVIFMTIFLQIILSCHGMKGEKSRQVEVENQLLSISLQEGFSNDKVVVHCNDTKVYERSDVTSDIRYGLADSFDIPIEEGLNQIKVTLADKGLSQTFQIQSANIQYVGISLVKGDLALKFSDVPFGYL